MKNTVKINLDLKVCGGSFQILYSFRYASLKSLNCGFHFVVIWFFCLVGLGFCLYLIISRTNNKNID